MKTAKWLGVGLATSMFASLVVGCGSSTNNAAPSTNGAATTPAATTEPQELTLNLGDEPDTLDSSKSTSAIAFDTLSLAFDGLTRLDKDKKATPGIATKWEHSPDFKQWTFHLRTDAKWSNGDPVTANDFVYALKRTLDPKTQAEYEFMAAWVVNGDAYNQGKAKWEDVGIKAPDANTVVYNFDHPVPFFDTQAAFAVFYPQNQKAVEAAKDKYGTDASTLVTDGPYKIDSWTHSQNLVLSKNTSYWNAADKDRYKLTKITLDMIKDQNTALNVYQSGDLDRVGLDKTVIDQYKSSPEYSTVPDLTNGYLQYNAQKNPVLANVKVRRALTLAIDRQGYADAIYHNGSVGSTGIVPNGTADGNGGEYRKDAGDLEGTMKPADAKALLAEGLKELNMTSFPKMSLLGDDSSTGKKSSQYLQDQWKQNLGINIDIESVPFKDRIARSNKGDFQIVFSLWGADYNDPMTFMDMFMSDSTFNEVHYKNADYDKFMKDAQQQTDLAKRAQDFVSAEKILMNDMPIGPILFRARAYLTKPYVKNFIPSPSGVEFILDYTSINGKKK